MVQTNSQEDTDRYWDAIIAMGARKRLAVGARTVGVFLAGHAQADARDFNGPDRDAARRAMDAMMTMTKIDIAYIERAAA